VLSVIEAKHEYFENLKKDPQLFVLDKRDHTIFADRNSAYLIDIKNDLSMDVIANDINEAKIESYFLTKYLKKDFTKNPLSYDLKNDTDVKSFYFVNGVNWWMSRGIQIKDTYGSCFD
jgi:hypothetical protein